MHLNFKTQKYIYLAWDHMSCIILQFVITITENLMPTGNGYNQMKGAYDQ